MRNDAQGFARRLASALERQHLRKKDFAQALGIAPRALSLYLHQGRIPRHELLVEMATALHVTTDWLLTGNPSTTAEMSGEGLADYKTGGSFRHELLTIAAELIDEEERQTLLRCAQALHKGDRDIREHLIVQLKMIEEMMATRKAIRQRTRPSQADSRKRQSN